MYDKDFCSIYAKCGFNDFSVIMGNAILKYLQNNSIKVTKHLDLCSGTGILCDLFAKQGIETKGIDLSLEMIRYAQENFPNIYFVCDNILNYKDNEKYDLITCTCDSINHILEEDDLEEIFLKVYSYLNDGGYFVFDIVDEDKITYGEEFVSVRDNGIVVKYILTGDIDGKFKNHMEVFDGNRKIYEEEIIEKIYSVSKVKKNLEEKGFQVLLCASQLLNEEQRVHNKMYFVVRK